MAKIVIDAFAYFNTNFVNLDPARTQIARDSRDWLVGQLISLPDKVVDFPKLYDGMHIQYGSFARNTKIHPLDDIDMFLTFYANGTTYLKNGNSYPLTTPPEALNLRKLCNDDGTLNSIKVVNKIVSSLSQIEHYKAAEIHRRQEAATLQLSSYEWNFDIVPAFYTDTGVYVIPDGQGGWKGTNPKKDDDRVKNVIARHGKIILQIIRTLKYWNRRAMMLTIPSYLFENIILEYLESQSTLNQRVDRSLINFWHYLQTAIYQPVNDPKGCQVDLNTLSFNDKTNISAKALDAQTKGYDAYKFEAQENDHQKAINKWREIFGDGFPKYE